MLPSIAKVLWITVTDNTSITMQQKSIMLLRFIILNGDLNERSSHSRHVTE